MTASTGGHVRRNRDHWEGEAEAYRARNRSQLNRWDALAWGVYDYAPLGWARAFSAEHIWKVRKA